MFNRLRDLSTGGGGTGASNAPANASLTFDDGDAVIHFENQLQAPPGAPVITQPQEADGFAAPQVAFLGAGVFNRREPHPPHPAGRGPRTIFGNRLGPEGLGPYALQ
jgi:hypothetical protein